MRVSDGMIMRVSIERVQQNLALVEEARDRVSTGLRVQKPSDDPVAASRIMETSGELRANAQHRRNIERGMHRVATEELALNGLTDLLAKAREIATQQGGATAGATSRQVAAIEAKGLIDTAIGLANTRFGDTFLFGGMYATTQPFAADGTTTAAQPPAGTHQVEIARGTLAATNHDGMTVFVGTAALSALQGLEAALLSGNSNAITSMSTSLDAALDAVQELIGEVGVRAQVFETARTVAEDAELNLIESRSDARDIDLARAITELLGRQSALDAALLSIGRTSRSLAEIL